MTKGEMSTFKIAEKYVQSIRKTHSEQVVLRTQSRLSQFLKIANENGLDLININKDEAVTIVENMSIMGHSYLSDVDNTLVRFLNWCHKNEYRENETIARFDYDEIDLSKSIGRTHFKNAADFASFLDKYYEPLSANLIENSHRTFLWLLYLGVNTKDVLTVMKQDVVLNKSNHYIIYKNNKINIPSEALRTFEYAIDAHSFVKTFRNGYKIIEYTNPNTLVGYSGGRPFNTIQHYINLKELEPIDKGKLRFNIVIRSGLYFRMYLKEQSNQKLDYLEIVQDGSHDMRYYRRLEKYLINDYRDWKRAFNL